MTDTANAHADIAAPAGAAGEGNLSRSVEGNPSRKSEGNLSRRSGGNLSRGGGTTPLAAAAAVAIGDDEGAEYDIDLTTNCAQFGWRLVGPSTKGMKRTGGHKLRVLVVMLSHIYRDGDEGFRARHPADPALKHLNSVLVGTAPVADLVAAGNAMLQGVGRQQSNNIMSWGLVAALPVENDNDANWLKVLDWVETNPTTKGMPVLSFVVHRDQPGAGPHAHITVLPVRAGERVGRPEPAVLRGSFDRFCRNTLGIRLGTPEERKEAVRKVRADRKEKRAKTLGELAASTGKGAKTAAAAAARDAELMARIDTVTGEFLPEETREGFPPRNPQMPCTQVSATSPTTTSEPSTTAANPTGTETAQTAELARLRAEVARLERELAGAIEARQRDAADPASTTCSTPDRLAHLAVLFASARAPMRPCPKPLQTTPRGCDAIDQPAPPPAPPAPAAKPKRRPRVVSVDNLGGAPARLLALMSDGKWRTSTDIAAHGLPGLATAASVLELARALAEVGLAESRGTGKATRWGTDILAWRTSAAGRAMLTVTA